MKINGVKVEGAYEEVVVIPRITGNLVFRARAIADYERFEKLCPQPKAPFIQYAGHAQATQNIEDPDYLEKFQEWAEQKSHWMILESLKATEGLEWETVEMGDSSTWKNYSNEMTESGLSPAEQARIVMCVSQANGLDQSKIDEATASFLADQAARLVKENSPASAPLATPSGVPANA